MNPLKKLAGQTLVYGMGTIVPRMLTYAIMTPLYTNYLKNSPLYGNYTAVYAYVAFFMVFLPLGMETSFFRFAQVYGKDKAFSTASTNVGIISILFALIACLFAPTWANIMEFSGHTEYIYLMALTVAIDGISTIPFAKLRQENRPGKFARLKLLNTSLLIVFNILFIVVLPSLAKSYNNIFLQNLYQKYNLLDFILFANLLSSFIVLTPLIPEFFKIKWQFDKKVFRSMILYGLPLVVVGSAGWINDNLDKIFLKYAVNTETSGLYGANYKIAILMILFVQMFRYAAEPFFFAESKKENAQKTYAQVMQYFILIGWLFFLGVCLYLDIIKHFVNHSFWIGLNAVPVVLLANLFFGIYFNLSIWYKLTNKTYYGAIMSIIGSLITIGLNIYLVPRYSYMGSAWATFGCYFGMMLISYFWGKKHFAVRYPLKRIAIYSISALAIYFISIKFAPEHFWGKMGFNTVLLVIYLLLAAHHEIKKISLLIRDKLKRSN
ncbi:MAG: polysaccharide biosynthesis C-terminal domain-containing protein [Bacteroidales bacterium]